jgi:hypothetical protein
MALQAADLNTRNPTFMANQACRALLPGGQQSATAQARTSPRR